MPSSRGSSRPKNLTQVSRTEGGFFFFFFFFLPFEPPGKPFEHLLGVILGVTGSWIRVRHEDEIKTQVLPSKGLFIS